VGRCGVRTPHFGRREHPARSHPACYMFSLRHCTFAGALHCSSPVLVGEDGRTLLLQGGVPILINIASFLLRALESFTSSDRTRPLTHSGTVPLSAILKSRPMCALSAAACVHTKNTCARRFADCPSSFHTHSRAHLHTVGSIEGCVVPRHDGCPLVQAQAQARPRRDRVHAAWISKDLTKEVNLADVV
jgi:hypothetical protein